MQIIIILSIIGAACFSVFNISSPSQIWIFPVLFISNVVLLSLAYWLLLGIMSLGISMKKEYEKPSPFYQFLLNAAYWFVCTAGRVKVHTSGMEKIPQNRKFLFVSNHLSRFDPMIQCLVLRRTPLAFISKPSNFKIPIGRRFMNRSCYIAIDRESPRNAAKAIGRATDLVRKNAVSIGVYPEGHRGNGYELQEFKPGCLKVAMKSNCPIVVAVIAGTEKIHKNFPWKKTDVYLNILEVVEPESKEKTTELSDRIKELMQRNLYEIT